MVLCLLYYVQKTAHNPIRRSSIKQACWLTCAHYIMRKSSTWSWSTLASLGSLIISHFIQL